MGDVVKHCKATLVIKQLEKALEVFKSGESGEAQLPVGYIRFCLEAGIERIKLEQLRGNFRNSTRASPAGLCGEIVPFRLS